MVAQHLLLIFTLVFLLQVLLVLAVVNVSSTLSTNGNHTSWLSPSGEFAFGFRQLTGYRTGTFSVAIWYTKIPDKTVVWYAKSNNDLAEAPAGSQVQLKKEGLALTSPTGGSIWTAKPAGSGGGVVSYGAMLDSGNFVLVNEESKNVWESFQNPTDTLLPNQSLDRDGTLTSRFTETNYTRGRFQLLVWGGNFMFCPLTYPSTYSYSHYYQIDSSGNASRFVYNTSGDIYVVTTNGTTRVQLEGEAWQHSSIPLDDPKRYYYRATLEYHGVFTQYAHPRDTAAQQGWKIARYIPDNICTAIDSRYYNGGSCGYNSYCSMVNQRPACNCPNGYSLVDPSNLFGGCLPNFTVVCGEGAARELYDLLESRGGYFAGVDYESIYPFSKEECQQSCLHDCMCAAAVFDDGQTCTKKGFPLINGRVEEQPGKLIFVKKGRALNSNKKEDHGADKPKPILLGSLIGSSILVSSMLLGTLVLCILLKKPKRSTVQAAGNFDTNIRSFTYGELEKATNNFREELGRGSFGIVYKGTLSPNHVVAVKKLNGSGQEGDKDFKTEVSAIGNTSHKNLVKLVGFCDEGMHRMLVYEFMSNGTLADVLFGQAKPIWNQRVGFALGIARGLVYLHEECDAPIIHCDIKPQNILIDEHLTAKISDFGLAKLLLRDQSRTNTDFRGTRGYMAPEWEKEVPAVATTKVDVYSFGVTLLVIICCRKPMEENKPNLTDWACRCYMDKTIDALVENDMEALNDSDKLNKWVKIAILCIQEHPETRPTMWEVFQMLHGSVLLPGPPNSN